MLVQHFLENSASLFPDKVALICDDRRLTYRDINRSADQMAGALLELGIKRHDRVVIFLDNTIESIISLFAILKAGAVFVIINPTMKSKKLNYILKDSGACALITQGNKIRVVKEAINETTALEHIFWVGKSKQLLNISLSMISSHLWEEIFSSPASFTHPPRTFSIDLDLATIIYTSGSTGEPKGVMSAHYNVIAAAKSISQYLENTQKDIIMSALPLSFDYGLYQILMAFLFGGTVVLEKSFVYSYKIIEKLIQEKVTGFPIVPTMLAILLQMEDLGKFDWNSLRYISNTAAALPVAHIRKLQQVLPNVKIYSMYGLTECKRVSYLPPEQLDHKPQSVGIPIPNEEVFIINEEGQQVNPGEIGELVVRGSNVMRGYWNDPIETERVFRPGRYLGETLLHTGDLFKMDKEGFLYFIARKDDLIKTKGERVSPKEIENVLCEIDGIVEAAIIGVPDEILGHAIKAFLITNNRRDLTEKEVMKYCMENLEPFMIPKYFEFRSILPKTTSGKIDKKKLK